MEIRFAQPSDFDLLLSVDDGLFDAATDPDQTRAFLNDPHHHLVLVLEAGQIVAFASGTGMLHPDKRPALFINEVATRPAFQRRGHARAALRALIDRARGLGYGDIWLATEPDNHAARALYQSLAAREEPVVVYAWDAPPA